MPSLDGRHRDAVGTHFRFHDVLFPSFDRDNVCAVARKFDGVQPFHAGEIQDADFVKRFCKKFGDDLHDAP